MTQNNTSLPDLLSLEDLPLVQEAPFVVTPEYGGIIMPGSEKVVEEPFVIPESSPLIDPASELILAHEIDPASQLIFAERAPVELYDPASELTVAREVDPAENLILVENPYAQATDFLLDGESLGEEQWRVDSSAADYGRIVMPVHSADEPSTFEPTLQEVVKANEVETNVESLAGDYEGRGVLMRLANAFSPKPAVREQEKGPGLFARMGGAVKKAASAVAEYIPQGVKDAVGGAVDAVGGAIDYAKGAVRGAVEAVLPERAVEALDDVLEVGKYAVPAVVIGGAAALSPSDVDAQTVTTLTAGNKKVRISNVRNLGICDLTKEYGVQIVVLDAAGKVTGKVRYACMPKAGKKPKGKASTCGTPKANPAAVIPRTFGGKNKSVVIDLRKGRCINRSVALAFEGDGKGASATYKQNNGAPCPGTQLCYVPIRPWRMSQKQYQDLVRKVGNVPQAVYELLVKKKYGFSPADRKTLATVAADAKAASAQAKANATAIQNNGKGIAANGRGIAMLKERSFGNSIGFLVDYDFVRSLGQDFYQHSIGIGAGARFDFDTFASRGFYMTLEGAFLAPVHGNSLYELVTKNNVDSNTDSTTTTVKDLTAWARAGAAICYRWGGGRDQKGKREGGFAVCLGADVYLLTGNVKESTVDVTRTGSGVHLDQTNNGYHLSVIPAVAPSLELQGDLPGGFYFKLAGKIFTVPKFPELSGPGVEAGAGMRW